jgi:hypothetical protein
MLKVVGVKDCAFLAARVVLFTNAELFHSLKYAE